jgi:ATP/maltotriose-dependent transcriptional regulator MalT/DNA-binding SARP family transcriptional activator
VSVPPLAPAGGHFAGMADYPIQVSKVQSPPLRKETLPRDRLLEWLTVKIHRRVILVVAEAGYGKTTLLADFSRRTRLRVLWFRLDHGDRDWVGFLAYLVAAVRVHQPDFGSATSALLRETATAAPPRDLVLDTFLRELGDLPPDASALVFDDFHLVDDSPDVRHVIRELLTRAPERLSFVFASRREPPIRLARLRSLGEVATLGTDDLRFDALETERLFRETYEMRLEPGLVTELARRTEGWAASLELVRTALHDRNPSEVRAFISSLSGAEGHLYDYLAEEVVGDLPDALQEFLMRTSLLEVVDLLLGPVAAGVSEAQARTMISDAERLGLAGKRGPNTRYQVRAHPLVRDFLQDRLTRALGPAAVRDIHRRIAEAAEPIDWQIAASHHLASGNESGARRVIGSSIEAILATGAYAAAQELTARLSDGRLHGAPGLVLQSRLAQQRGGADEGLKLAEQAWSMDRTSTAVLLNLVTARSLAGDVAGSIEAGRLLEQTARPQLAEIGRVYRLTMETSVNGSLNIAARDLASLAVALRERGEHHYLGVALLNLAYIKVEMSQPSIAVECADEAIAYLSATSAGVELVSARLARAVALAFGSQLQEARREVDDVAASATIGQSAEVAFEAAQLEALLGNADRASSFLATPGMEFDGATDNGEHALWTRAYLRLRAGDLSLACAEVAGFQHRAPRSSPAFEVKRLMIEALLDLLGGRDAALTTRLARYTGMASRQGARLWERVGDLLLSLSDDQRNHSEDVARHAKADPTTLSLLCEPLVLRLDTLNDAAKQVIFDEAGRRPERWRGTARRIFGVGTVAQRVAAGWLLDEIGESSDIRLLRDGARHIRDRSAIGLGHRLSRRLARRVLVEDLGRVRILIGTREVSGDAIRRKVLALLCLLLTKPQFSSTREDVIEHLWPDQDPDSALNSLNQTVYFLRRVFEPSYRDDTSPGYVVQDGETIWLDNELIDSKSRRCLELIRSISNEPSPDEARALATIYTGRFALDFAYEPWAEVYRDSMHSSVLRLIERSVRMDVDSGQVTRALYLAERAAEVDPESEEIQLLLVRLCQLSDAHAAAAERYTRYSAAARDLGLDPVPLDQLERGKVRLGIDR